jgi:hypothetical protein
MTVFGTFDPSPTESWMVYNCAKSWSASTIYRSLPESLMTTNSASSTTTTTSSSDGGPGMITGAPDLNSAEGGDTAEESESPQSQAWIAGVVIGCVVAGGAVAGLGFWLGRRRKRGHGREDPQNKSAFHTSTLLGLGGQPGGQTVGEYYYAPSPGDNTNHSMPHGQPVTVAGGVEMEGSHGAYYSDGREKGLPISLQEAPTSMSIELATEPVRKTKPYV